MVGDVVGFGQSVDEVAHVIQVALTPVFLLSGIASLLGVFATRLGRVADKVDQFSERLKQASSAERAIVRRRLHYLQRRSRLLDGAVGLGTLAGASTCVAAFCLFIGSLRNQALGTLLFVSFGVALLCTGGALGLFLSEILLASRGVRYQAAVASDEADTVEAAELPEPREETSDGSTVNITD